MAKLCEGCIFQGDCTGEVTPANVAQKTVMRPRRKLFKMLNYVLSDSAGDTLELGTYSRLADTDGNMSAVFPTGTKDPETIVTKIDGCNAPRGNTCGAFPGAERPYGQSAARFVMSKQALESVLAQQLQLNQIAQETEIDHGR
jgi:hypothetical protein